MSGRIGVQSGTAELRIRRPLTNTCVEVPPWLIVPVPSKAVASRTKRAGGATCTTNAGASTVIRCSGRSRFLIPSVPSKAVASRAWRVAGAHSTTNVGASTGTLKPPALDGGAGESDRSSPRLPALSKVAREQPSSAGGARSITSGGSSTVTCIMSDRWVELTKRSTSQSASVSAQRGIVPACGAGGRQRNGRTTTAIPTTFSASVVTKAVRTPWTSIGISRCASRVIGGSTRNTLGGDPLAAQV